MITNAFCALSETRINDKPESTTRISSINKSRNLSEIKSVREFVLSIEGTKDVVWIYRRDSLESVEK